jgi:acyl carrier protein
VTRYPPEPPGREEVVTIVAKLGDRTPDNVTEQIGSLEVAWLISEVEQQYHVTLEFSDEALAQMATISGAVATLADLLSGVPDG